MSLWNIDTQMKPESMDGTNWECDFPLFSEWSEPFGEQRYPFVDPCAPLFTSPAPMPSSLSHQRPSCEVILSAAELDEIMARSLGQQVESSSPSSLANPLSQTDSRDTATHKYPSCPDHHDAPRSEPSPSIKQEPSFTDEPFQPQIEHQEIHQYQYQHQHQHQHHDHDETLMKKTKGRQRACQRQKPKTIWHNILAEEKKGITKPPSDSASCDGHDGVDDSDEQSQSNAHGHMPSGDFLHKLSTPIAKRPVQKPFIRFCSIVRHDMKRMNPSLSNHELMKVIALTWHQLDEAQKNVYRYPSESRAFHFIDMTNDVHYYAQQ